MEFGERNEKGNTNLDFTTSYSLMSVNTHFRIYDEHLITFKIFRVKSELCTKNC